MGGIVEFSGYGWIASASMIGVVRPEPRYAVPMSWMKTVGEWVSRPEPGRSIPRGEIAPPYTIAAGFAAFSASYVFASSDV